MPEAAVSPEDPHDAAWHAALIARVPEGDTTAHGELVTVYQPRCLRYACRMLGDRDEAEDVTQVTLSRASADGTRTLTIQLAGAHELELMGDVTAWRPVQMAPAGHDRWTVRLEMRPGLHRLNLRVDGGAWSTVPSLPQLTDDFGVVSVLVVP